METSIIIRVKNESESLKEVLSILKRQTYQQFELVIVDNNSHDGSERLVFHFFDKKRIKIVKIHDEQFTHANSCNIGAEISSGTYLVFMNGHSTPISYSWLEDGLSNFKERNVAGVFAYPFANKKANILEKARNYINTLIHFNKIKFRSYRIGMLGTTNAIIRKSLWSQYNFNDKYINGGEDGDWARHWLSKGYVIIQDPKFRVYHSHNLSLIGLIKEQCRWIGMSKIKE